VARFLFHALPLVGHVHPMAAVARALAARGHEVAWAGSVVFLRPLLGEDVPVYGTGMRLYRGGLRDRGMAAARSRWEGYIVPHARFAMDAVTAAAREFGADALAVDQHALAGALAAHRCGLPWATMAATTMELTRPYRALPKVEAWIDGLMATLWRDAGLAGPPPHDLRFSPHLVVAFTAPALLDGYAGDPDKVALVGPALADRPGDDDFPFDWLDPDRRHVLVTVGTLAQDVAADFYRRMVEALRPLRGEVQAVFVAPEAALGDVDDHILVVARAPVLALLPHLHAVVSHGGLNTVCETLAHGVPLVVAPIKGDQPINAEQVVAAGAGRRVSFVRSRPAALRAALRAVLDDPTYAAAARRLAADLARAGGAEAAALRLEELVRQPVG
jgi:MGT family glycosyltransferase